MALSQPLLTIVDPNAEQHTAVARTAWLAESLGAPLELFICDARDPSQPGAGSTHGRAAGASPDAQLDLLRRLAAPLIARGLTVEVDARRDPALEQGVARKAGEIRPWLVAKDTDYHAVSRRALFSHADWGLIRSCPAPLLLAKPHEIGAAPVVLAAVDPTHEHDKPAQLDHDILSFANRLTAAIGGELHVFHAFDPAPVIAGASHSVAAPVAVPVGELTAGLERQHAQALQALLAAHEVSEERVHFEQGAPHELLVELAERIRADFVVMGAVSRSGLRRVFVGSTAERVLDRLPCDLVIVKTA